MKAAPLRSVEVANSDDCRPDHVSASKLQRRLASVSWEGRVAQSKEAHNSTVSSSCLPVVRLMVHFMEDIEITVYIWWCDSNEGRILFFSDMAILSTSSYARSTAMKSPFPTANLHPHSSSAQLITQEKKDIYNTVPVPLSPM